MKSRDVIHHRGYDGSVFYTVEEEIENLRHGVLTQDFTLSGDISPTALSGNVDDYAPTGLSTATVLRIDGGASNRNITGITGGADGRVLIVLNIGTTNSLVLKNDVTSTAANRFLFGADITLRIGAGIVLWYDSTSTRWRGGTPQLTTATGLTGGSTTGSVGLDLNALTEDTAPDGAADYVATYDTSAGSHKKVKVPTGVLGTYTALSSTATTITGISANAKMVIVNLVGVSWDATAALRIRIGPSGGVATSGYLGAGGLADTAVSPTWVNGTVGMDSSSILATNVYHGQMMLTLADASTNTWLGRLSLGHSNSASQQLGTWSVPLSGVLERVTITTIAGTASADAGSASVLVYT